MTAEKALPLWTPAFALLCCAQFFGSAQHALLQPTFPLFITSLGGTPLEVGFVLACFAVTSVVFRPLIGGWADRWSEPRVLTCGLLILSGAVFLCFIPLAEVTMFANALRGIGALICGGLVQSVGFLWMYLAIAGIAGGGLLLTIANRAHLK
jgi:DHA1 family multidrug resistance protein-like MFS transporter